MRASVGGTAGRAILRTVMVLVVMLSCCVIEGIATIEIARRYDINTVFAFLIVLLASFAISQKIFWSYLPASYINVIDYCCVFLAIIPLLAFSDLALRFYNLSGLQVPQATVEQMFHNARAVSGDYLARHCTNLPSDAEPDGPTGTRCRVVTATASFLNAGKALTPAALEDFLSEAYDKLDPTYLSFKIADADTEAGDFNAVFSAMVLLRNMSSYRAGTVSHLQELAPLLEISGDLWFRGLSAFIAAKIIFCKLGLILTKARQAALRPPQ